MFLFVLDIQVPTKVPVETYPPNQTTVMMEIILSVVLKSQN